MRLHTCLLWHARILNVDLTLTVASDSWDPLPISIKHIFGIMVQYPLPQDSQDQGRIGPIAHMGGRARLRVVSCPGTGETWRSRGTLYHSSRFVLYCFALVSLSLKVFFLGSFIWQEWRKSIYFYLFSAMDSPKLEIQKRYSRRVKLTADQSSSIACDSQGVPRDYPGREVLLNRLRHDQGWHHFGHQMAFDSGLREGHPDWVCESGLVGTHRVYILAPG